MKNQIYDKNYSNQDMTIPASIWNNKKINGFQKILLSLYKKLTKDGQQKVQFMSLMQAQICATHEKDILYNAKQLHQKGFIKLTKHEGKVWINYTYVNQPNQPTETSAGLF